MLRKLLILTFSALVLTGCGYDGSYRYPCQDPTNWETAECKPPICTASGSCPVDLTPSLKQGAPNE